MAAASSGTGIVQHWLLLPMAGDEQHRDTCFVSPAVTLYNVRPRSTNGHDNLHDPNTASQSYVCTCSFFYCYYKAGHVTGLESCTAYL